MKRLRIAEEVPASAPAVPLEEYPNNPFKKSIAAVESLLKEMKDFIVKFNVPTGISQLSEQGWNKFKKTYQALIHKNMTDLIEVLEERPAKTSCLNLDKLRRCRYLSFLICARLDPRFTQEINRWDAVLKTIQGQVQALSQRFPTKGNKAKELFVSLFDNVSTLKEILSFAGKD